MDDKELAMRRETVGRALLVKTIAIARGRVMWDSLNEKQAHRATFGVYKKQRELLASLPKRKRTNWVRRLDV